MAKLHCGKCQRAYDSAYRGRHPLCKRCRTANQAEASASTPAVVSSTAGEQALLSQLAALSVDDGWGDRPRGPPAEQELLEAVLLNPDYQSTILDALGLTGTHLAGVNSSWRAAVAGRRAVWTVLEAEPEKSFGGEGSAPGQFHCPMGVASLPEGAVCVADSMNHRLQIFSKEQGAAPRVIGGRGKQPGQFRHPGGVASDGTSLYVADTPNHRVQKLRLADGMHLGTVGKADCSDGDGEGQFYWPTGLCVAAGALYVCDTGSHRIVVLSTDLTWRYTIGRRGSGDGEFDCPQGVVAHGGELYVADHFNHRVQVFAPDRRGRMRFARAFGGEGKAPGQFYRPWGVTVVRGLLVVSEYKNKRLQVLTPKGVPLQVITLGDSPHGLCADTQRVWMTEGNETVHAFKNI